MTDAFTKLSKDLKAFGYSNWKLLLVDNMK